MWGRERNKNPFYMNSSPVMTMVLQPGVQAPRNHGTIPMEARLWDRPPPPGAQERILTRRDQAVPKRIQQISSGTNTGRDSFTQTQPSARPRPRPEPTPPPALDLKDVQCQTPKRPTTRPVSAPSKKPKPNPILGEGGHSPTITASFTSKYSICCLSKCTITECFSTNENGPVISSKKINRRHVYRR